MAKNCVEETLSAVENAKKTLGELESADISRQEIEDFVQGLSDLKKANPGTPYAKLVKNRLYELREKSLKAEFGRRDQNLKLKGLVDYVTQDSFKDNPSEALKSIFVDGVNRLTKGGNNGTIRQAKALRHQILDPFYTAVDKLNAKKALESGDVDFIGKTIQAAYDIKTTGKTAHGPLYSELGNVINGVGSRLLESFHNAGYLVNDNFQRFFRQSMDPAKIGDVKKTARDILFGDIGKTIDHEGTFGLDKTDTEKLSILEGILHDKLYRNDRLGFRPMDELSPELINPKTNLPVENRVSQKRLLKFKPDKVGEGQALMISRYSDGDLMKAMYRTVDQDTKAASILAKFGIDPSSQYDKLVSTVAKGMEDANARQKFINDAKKIKETEFKSAAGFSEAPTVDFASHLARSAKNLTNMALLTLKAPFRALVMDPMNRAFLMRTVDGENFFSAITKSYSDQIKLIADPSAKKAILKEVYMQLNDMHLDHSRFGNGDEIFEDIDLSRDTGATKKIKKAAALAFGTINKAAEFSHNYLGMAWVDQGGTAATVKRLSNKLGDLAQKSFGELSNVTKSYFDRYGMTEPMWDLLRNNLVTHHDGTLGLSGRQLDSVDDSMIKSVIDKYDLKTSSKKLRQDAQLVWQGMASDFVDLSKNSPTAANQSLINNVIGRGTNAIQGETASRIVESFLKTASQFKAAQLAQFDITSRVALSDPSLKSAKMGGKALSYAQSLGPYVIFMMGIRYAADQMLNEIEGRPIDDPFSKDTVFKTFVNSGVGGLMADLAHDSVDKNFQDRFISFFAGPTVSRGVKAIGEVAPNVAQAKYSKASTKALENLSKNLPAGNLKFFGGKNIYDAILIDPMIEQINPGYMQRKEMRIQRQQYKAKYGP